MSDSLQPHGLELARLLCPWDSPGKNIRVGSHALLQRSSQSQGWTLHCRQILYHLSHQGKQPRWPQTLVIMRHGSYICFFAPHQKTQISSWTSLTDLLHVGFCSSKLGSLSSQVASSSLALDMRNVV